VKIKEDKNNENVDEGKMIEKIEHEIEDMKINPSFDYNKKIDKAHKISEILITNNIENEVNPHDIIVEIENDTENKMDIE